MIPEVTLYVVVETSLSEYRTATAWLASLITKAYYTGASRISQYCGNMSTIPSSLVEASVLVHMATISCLTHWLPIYNRVLTFFTVACWVNLYWSCSCYGRGAGWWIVKRTELGDTRWYNSSTITSSQERRSLSAPVESMPVRIDEVLRYEVGWLCNVICFTVAIPSHQILQLRVWATVSDNLIYDI